MHTLELYSIWGSNNTDTNDPKCYTIPAAQGGCQESIGIMQSYWISFVRTLNPNTLRDPRLPEWASYSVCSQNRMVFNNGNASMELVGSGFEEVDNAGLSQAQRCRGLTGTLSKSIVANLKAGQTLGQFANGTMTDPTASCATGGSGTLAQVTTSPAISWRPATYGVASLALGWITMLF